MPASWKTQDYNQQHRWSIDISGRQARQISRLDINNSSGHFFLPFPSSSRQQMTVTTTTITGLIPAYSQPLEPDL